MGIHFPIRRRIWANEKLTPRHTRRRNPPRRRPNIGKEKRRRNRHQCAKNVLAPADHRRSLHMNPDESGENVPAEHAEANHNRPEPCKLRSREPKRSAHDGNHENRRLHFRSPHRNDSSQSRTEERNYKGDQRHNH